MPEPFHCRCGHRLPPAAFAGGMAAWCPACSWPVAPPAGPVSARRVARPAPPPPEPVSRRLRVKEPAPADDRDDEDDLPRPVRSRPAGRSLWQPEYVRPLMIGGTVVLLFGVAVCGGLVYTLDPFGEKPAVAGPTVPPPVAAVPPPTKAVGDRPPVAKAKQPVTPAKAAPKPATPGRPPAWTGKPPSELLVGDWEIDLQAMPAGKRADFAGASLRFTADRSFRTVFPAGEVDGLWAPNGGGDRLLRLRLVANDRAKQPPADTVVSVVFTSDDHLEFEALRPRHPDATVRCRFKRAGAVSAAGPE